MPNCMSSRYAEKRQRTAALQDAAAFFGTLLLPRGFGVRLSSATFISLITAGKHSDLACARLVGSPKPSSVGRTGSPFMFFICFEIFAGAGLVARTGG